MSKYLFFDFRCSQCNNTFDDLVKPDIFEIPCPECQAPAARCVSTPRLDPRMGFDPDFATSGDKWKKMNKQKTQQDKAFYAKHGVDKLHHSYGS
jgi:hypothetical protein